MSADLPPNETASESFPVAKPHPNWPYVMAALAIAALVAIRPWQSTPAGSAPEKKAVADPGVYDAPGSKPMSPGEPKALLPSGPATSRPDRFIFQQGQGAGGHWILLYGADGQLKWTSDLFEGNTCPLPNWLLLEDGRYFWQVVAQPPGTKDAKGRIPSALVEFEIYRAH